MFTISKTEAAAYFETAAKISRGKLQHETPILPFLQNFAALKGHYLPVGDLNQPPLAAYQGDPYLPGHVPYGPSKLPMPIVWLGLCAPAQTLEVSVLTLAHWTNYRGHNNAEEAQFSEQTEEVLFLPEEGGTGIVPLLEEELQPAYRIVNKVMGSLQL